jgi:PKD repeat protein
MRSTTKLNGHYLFNYKTRRMKKFLQIFSVSTLCLASLHAQVEQQPIEQANYSEDLCGFDLMHNKLLAADADYRAKTEEFNLMLAKGIEQPKAGGVIYKVPVVVHVLHLGESIGSGSNISDAAINQGIRQVNERFRKVAGSLGDGNGVDVEIEFSLAVRDPSGNCTNGIVRVDLSGNATYAASGVQAASGSGITDGALKSASRWDPTSYYNIYLITEFDNNNCGFGVQGYAYFATSHGTSVDGMVQLGCKFAESGNTTLTHELGHAFNLYHTFQGDGGGGSCPTNSNCSADGDRCCDTPPHRRSSSNCVVATNTCTGGTSNDHIHNYMDYSSDACQSDFTSDQEARISAAMIGLRSSFLESNGNLSLVPPTAPSTDFSVSSTAVCLGTPVSFYDESTCTPNTYQNGTWTGITFNWTFDDGVNVPITSTLQNPTINFPTAGSYSVTLSVTNSFGTSALAKSGYVNISAVSATSGCVPTSSNEGNFGHTISNISLNTLTNGTSTSSNVAYTDYSCTKSTALEAGLPYNLSITINAGGSGNEEFGVYIDYNNDGTFAAGELVMSNTTGSNSSQTFNQNITMPITANLGTMLRLRVVADANGFSTPCGNHFIGETEDYGVFVFAPGVLPIELISFDATVIEETVSLNWSTASEQNNDFFTIERSLDGETWEFVNSIDGAGNSNSLISYSSRDDSPYSGQSYYRIKQTDFDGKVSVSNIRTVELRSSVEVKAYPNPFTDKIKLAIYSKDASSGFLTVTNLLGKIVSSQSIQISEGTSTIPLDISGAQAGLYLVRLDLDHSESTVVQIMKR